MSPKSHEEVEGQEWEASGSYSQAHNKQNPEQEAGLHGMEKTNKI